MKYVVGLGNPGEQYAQTRHNVGFMVVEAIAARLGMGVFAQQKKMFGELCSTSELKILKPSTFMNDSGRAVRALMQFYGEDFSAKQPQPLQLDNLVVCHDDLDIPFGSFKIQFGRGPKVHNGLLSLYQHLGTDAFWHVRIGVDGRQGDRSMPAQAYVLSKFAPDETKVLSEVITAVAERVASEQLA